MERSITEVLENGLRQADAQWRLAYLLNADIAKDKVAFVAQFLTRQLAPILTAIQEHDNVCPTFQLEGKTGVSFSVDGAALPPFNSRKSQEEIGGAITSKFHVGE